MIVDINSSKEDLIKEIEILQGQVVTTSAKLNASVKQLANHPAQIELNSIKSKWWFRLFTWLKM